MLAEIRCEKFRKETISFHKGLNVVLGDENATNSIGKSSLLMVIDFAFGGNGLLARKDIIDELGHHDYYISFEFEGEIYRFRRGTYQPDIVYKCSIEYEAITAIPVEEYTAFLKAVYSINIEEISFRSFVGLYLRVWGKDNLNVHRPLHIVQNMSAKNCINNLIKTFGRYSAIKELTEKLKQKDEESKALRSAFKNRIIPKIGKREYKDNEERITRIELEIEDIKTNLSKYATNIAEVVNREVLELKIQKDELLAIKLNTQSKLSRIKRNISENRHIKSKHFNSLIQYFPEINKERLANVEEFHSSVARILRSELRETERELEGQLFMINNELSKLDSKMTNTLSSIDEPNKIVDRVYELSTSFHNAKEENEYYENDVSLKNDVKQIKGALSDEKTQVLSLLQKTINDSIRRIVTSVFGPDRKSPTIQLKETNYSYEVVKDTGTGTAYASLIVLDLAIFNNTILPFVAHDSLLFKNIENDSVSNLFKIYSGTEKQSFVAIDEVEKYGTETSTLLRSNSVVQLDDNNVLYKIDWRK
ncbi:conserved hypothetical protein [Desulfosarcina cetonica]|uniref:DUF2326 domain-containing protein n=1 Tax=Desulfosarcina cetonica TaxID=90730 RepID=UPI000A8ACF2F|nr:DUF2326 domain-containing protein [Desulfosarcina cetonica]VTR66274.1 conserved hypothetical protein [Desulfosarcina cetonica]